MNWYYVDAGQQAGPVDDAQLAELVGSGKVRPETLVWHDGMTAWTTYREAIPMPGSLSNLPTLSSDPIVPHVANENPTAATDEAVICSECRRSFLPRDVIRFGDKWVCANCKPIFFQRLREGATLPGGGVGISEAELLARDYEVDIGQCISQGWEVFKTNPGLLIGGSALVYLAIIVANMIPYLNIIAALLLNGPLMAGLWLLYLKRLRNQEAGLGDAFAGFGPRFWQLVLTQLIPALVAGGLVVILAALAIPTIMMMGRRGAGTAPALPGSFVLLGLLVLAAVVVVAYINVCWLFSLPLAADKGLKFWPALELSRRVVNKHWWMTFCLIFVSGLLAILGVLGCGVGLLVTAPIAFAAVVSHYQRVFGDLAPNPT